METLQALSLAMGSAWGSGINLYATVVMLGLMGRFGGIELPPDLVILTHPGIIAVAGFMYIVEFVADKIPGLDSLWDAIHTFIRIPAGAILAARAVGDLHPALEIMAYLAGGGIAALSHTTKAGTRAALNLSPEPVTNIAASLTEDLLTVGGIWTAFNYPTVLIGGVGAFLVLAIWLLPKFWRLFLGIFRRVQRLFK